MKKNLIVHQEGNKDCGAACLLSIIRYYGGNISIDKLIELTKTTKEGTNFFSISSVAEKIGLQTKCYKIDDLSKINELCVPFIAQLNIQKNNHFVVIYKVETNKITIMDPAKGKIVIDEFEFTNNFTGYIMMFEKVRPLIYNKEQKILNKIILESINSNKKIIVSLLILSLIVTVLSVVTSLYSQIVFDEIIDTTMNNLIVITLLFSILYTIKIITNYVRNYLLIHLNQKIDLSIILNTFSKIILLPFSYYKNKTTGEVLTRINDLSYVKTFISKIIIMIFLDVLTFISSSVIIYRINKMILLYLLMISFLYFILIIIFNYFIKKLVIENQNNNSNVNNCIIESVSSFETIKGLSLESNIIYKFSRLYSKSLNTLYKTEKTNNIMIAIKETITDIGMLIINFISIKLIIDKKITIGNYMTISLLKNYIIYPMKNIIDILNEYQYTKSSIKRADNLFEVGDEKIYDEEKLEVTGNIKINDLNFTYNNKTNILNNISFNIKEKEKVLILGESGIGKSTILKLLYKYYNCERDKIYINNYDINDFSMKDIRNNITFISQNELLYTDTIRNNIIMDRNINEKEYLKVCQITYVNDIIKDNILGYDYKLEENGINISGGQRQRIILARSLLKKSKIIMIDEGLNQLDINTERKILKNIFNIYNDKTFIIISHRKENMDLYDKVIFLKEGKTIISERSKS